MFRKILIANRGEIARRIVRTCKRMGIASVAVYSDADRFTPGVLEADEAVRLGPAPVTESYLNVEAVIAACKATGAQAVHPGYGFLSENVAFAERLEAEGIVFIGPRPEHLRAFGLKHTARDLAKASGVPLLPGTDLLPDLDAALAAAETIGYPVMLKSTAGGGGIGMRLCASAEELRAHYTSVERTARASFGDARVYLERFVGEARHVEVQIFGDGQGRVVALGERDCSLQRRNQKVIEETPAPGLSDAVRARLHRAAATLGESVSYASAGTVEFIYDPARQDFSFLEVNTRLQVEHPVTEAVFSIDLVEWMIRQSAGEDVIGAAGPLMPKGAAIEARLYAEIPHADFAPSAGLLTQVVFPGDARIDGWIATGTEVTPFYDPMLAKIIVTGEDRASAIAALRAALDATVVGGIETNLGYLRAIAASDLLSSGRVATTALRDFTYRPRSIAVLAPGAQSSLQELPGRLGLWHVGVPPSGPMDACAFRAANALVGNHPDICALELTVSGPTLRLHTEAVVALAGAAMTARLDGVAQPHGQPFTVRSGQTLAIDTIEGPGMRTYLAVRGGFDAPVVLGSRATFALGAFGGHATGVLKAGDVLHLGDASASPGDLPPSTSRGSPLLEGEGQGEVCDLSGQTSHLTPTLSFQQREFVALTHDWTIGLIYGPHGAPDFFQDADIADLFSASYEVHFNSARTGVRLIGPTPRWAREDGGEAGLHPSNLHDNAYAVGALDFTGDMPILLGPDGPSLGGFVCPGVIAGDELWKIGQLRPGDRVRFVAVERAEDAASGLFHPHPHPEAPERSGGLEGRLQGSRSVLEASFEAADAAPQDEVIGWEDRGVAGSPILSRAASGPVEVVYRRQGDDNLLVEYGPMALDIGIRLRVHLLAEAVAQARLPGLIDLTPGIRSLQIHYDGATLPRPRLLGLLREIEAGLGSADDVTVPSRIVHLPLSWNDPQAEIAMRKYQDLVRPNAPWCPSNIEFIRRINGLDSEEAVRRIVFDASYLVMGLGDVYLGAPVATPVDPRHRLVTTKYNPARTWTPENAVGIGGAYMCIYGMEGPGGYQLVGRTIQIWNTWRTTREFEPGHPWLLRPFDRIRFFPVDHDALTEARAAFPHGAYPVRIEDGHFSYAAHRAELAANASEIVAAKLRQQTAFEAERLRWKDEGLDSFIADEGAPHGAEDAIPAGCLGVPTTVPGNVWKVVVGEGDHVSEGQPLVILESMKMEVAVAAPAAGRVREVRVKPGRTLRGGDVVAVIQEE